MIEKEEGSSKGSGQHLCADAGPHPHSQYEQRLRVAIEMGIHRWLEWDYPGVAQEYAQGVQHILDSIMSVPKIAP